MSTPLEIKATCHCGAVELTATLPNGLDPNRCTCSFCARRQAAAVTAIASSVQITKGAENLTLYTWHTGAAKHLWMPLLMQVVFERFKRVIECGHLLGLILRL